jgi:hypothetical protein
MLEQVIIGKIIWCQGDATFYGTFDNLDEWEKWADACLEDDNGEIQEISYEVMFKTEKIWLPQNSYVHLDHNK